MHAAGRVHYGRDVLGIVHAGQQVGEHRTDRTHGIGLVHPIKENIRAVAGRGEHPDLVVGPAVRQDQGNSHYPVILEAAHLAVRVGYVDIIDAVAHADERGKVVVAAGGAFAAYGGGPGVVIAVLRDGGSRRYAGLVHHILVTGSAKGPLVVVGIIVRQPGDGAVRAELALAQM